MVTMMGTYNSFLVMAAVGCSPGTAPDFDSNILLF